LCQLSLRWTLERRCPVSRAVNAARNCVIMASLI
jgi:hypothetical protein